MTNYNERLYEILAKHNGEFYVARLLGITWEDPDIVTPDTKQAISSLIKELVADAKPEKHIHHHADGKPFEDAQDIAYNAAIDQFEQNLLKVLEEV